jgi:uncharacterized protein YkwD
MACWLRCIRVHRCIQSSISYLAVLGVAVCCATAVAQRGPSAQEIAVFQALNALRQDPASYIGILQSQRRLYRGNLLIEPGGVNVQTQEGIAAVDEAIAALRAVPHPPGGLEFSPGLAASAAQLVRENGARGLTGHEGPGGEDLPHRVSRAGKWSGSIGEDISFGDADPTGVIVQLLVDDGVSNRGHRRELLDPRWHYVGISCGPHSVYQRMCVLDFAVEFH